MTGESGNAGAGAQRTRRNIVKMGAILASAAVATLAATKRGVAGGGGNSQGGGSGNQDGNCQGGSGGHCPLKGTTIRTAGDDCKIEDLAIGDLLPTMFGGMRPVQWIGRYPLTLSV